MPQLFLAVIIAIIIITMSRRARSLLLHPILIRTISTFIFTTVFLAIALALGYFGWQWWQTLQARPTLEWKDSTVWEDATPTTPGIERTKSKIEIR